MTLQGLKAVATSADAEVIDHGDGWYHVTHPRTGNVLQLDPQGGLTVHAEHGSWHSGPNTTSTLTAIWKGNL